MVTKLIMSHSRILNSKECMNYYIKYKGEKKISKNIVPKDYNKDIYGVNEFFFSAHQAQLFNTIYSKIQKMQHPLTSDDPYYHEWILLLQILYSNKCYYLNRDNLIPENYSVAEVEKKYNEGRMCEQTFLNLKFLHDPVFVYCKSLEIGKFAPYTTV